MSEIKNCPFCGCSVPDDPGLYLPSIVCPDCGATNGKKGTKKRAEEAWNARVLPPEVERLVKAAEYLLDTLADLPAFSKEIEGQINNPESQVKDALAALKGK